MVAFNSDIHCMGNPCKRGHSGMRYMTTNGCVECSKMKSLEAQKRCHKKLQEAATETFIVGKPCVRCGSTRRYARNMQCAACSNVRYSEYHLKNSERLNQSRSARRGEGDKEYQKRYIEENRGAVNAFANKRRAAKLRRTPKWADLEKIKEFYENCPEGMAVDHIVPLQGKLVCGLHVHWNLQYLTKAENSAKYNKFEV